MLLHGGAGRLSIHRGAPPEFLDLRDPIPAASAARARLAAFLDRVPG